MSHKIKILKAYVFFKNPLNFSHFHKSHFLLTQKLFATHKNFQYKNNYRTDFFIYYYSYFLKQDQGHM